MKSTQNTCNKEYLKERIYGSLTLLAVNIGIFLHIEHISKIQALSTIFTTIFGLWLANIFAEILAEKTLHKNKTAEEFHNFRIHVFKNSLGILNSAKASIFLVFLTFFEIISLKIAIFSAITLTIIEFIFILFFAKKSNNLVENLIILGFQIIIFMTIILLKLGH